VALSHTCACRSAQRSRSISWSCRSSWRSRISSWVDRPIACLICKGKPGGSVGGRGSHGPEHGVLASRERSPGKTRQGGLHDFRLSPLLVLASHRPVPATQSVVKSQPEAQRKIKQEGVPVTSRAPWRCFVARHLLVTLAPVLAARKTPTTPFVSSTGEIRLSIVKLPFAASRPISSLFLQTIAPAVNKNIMVISCVHGDKAQTKGLPRTSSFTILHASSCYRIQVVVS